MKKIIYLFFLIFFCLGGLSGCGGGTAAEQGKAAEGVLQLHNHDFEEEQVYTLDGEWEFYWKQFIEPSSFPAASSSSVYVNTPGSWDEKIAVGKPLPNEGYATYHLQLLLPETIKESVAGLYIPEVATAYTLWADEKIIAENGSPGTAREVMEPDHHPRMVYFEPEEEAVDLVLHVSEYYQRKSGWWDSFYIGSADGIQKMRDKNVAAEVFLVVSLLVMALYHIGIFLLRPKERSPLYFSGICLAVAMRTLFLGEVLIQRFFPAVPWELGLKIEYWSACAAITFFLLFIHAQYKEDSDRRIRNGFLFLFAMIFLFILVTPARVYTEGMLVLQGSSVLAISYLIYVLITAMRNQRRGARAHVAAMTILLAFVVNDVLHYNHVVNTGETVSIGMFFYLFAQSFILSNVFTKALNDSEQLSERLEKVNQTLEEKVKKRTKKLSEANKDLEQSYKARRELMSNISHELNTPLTSIQGYMKGMLDGVVDRNQPKYFQLVYDKTLFLKQIIDDLRELAKLESDGIQYHFTEKDIREFTHELYLVYKEEIERKHITFRFEDRLPVSDAGYAVSIDPIRIEQVVSNLLFNAKKFTEAGGNITLVVEEKDDSGKSWISIAVQDDGAGIKEEELPNVFERFFKGNAVKEKAEEGVGLGLAISTEIVRAHEGKMRVNSTEGEGSTFYFLLPRTDSLP
ncbi:sensor histidine kinase [Salibacterium aidingense]|uniref:sensor histidine kinase n=1 Tax=Salibacterium aidingense TaxID=384933 RepID=UPI00041806C8|nr:sensor histidine kinase [Salibacterium aidingense]